MAESFLRLIRREQEHAQAGRSAHIIAKMNALLEPSVIDSLQPKLAQVSAHVCDM
jgi:polyphosphate kinase